MFADFVALRSMTHVKPTPAAKPKSGGCCLGTKRRGYTTIPVPRPERVRGVGEE
jgi:hypothetical protein